MDVLIDASRNRSGGAVAHIVGILNCEIDPSVYKIKKVYLCSYASLLDKIEDKPWLVKVNHRFLEKSIFHQFLWQIFILPSFFKKSKIDICLYSSATAFLRIKNSIVMSRDMLSFEPNHIELFPQFLVRLRLHIIGWLQIRSMRKAKNTVFLTKYAKSVISSLTGELNSISIIPHGLKHDFKNCWKKIDRSRNFLQLVYVSDAAEYKHHINVVKAIKSLRDKGYDLKIVLVGANIGTASKTLKYFIENTNAHKYVTCTDFLGAKDIIKHIQNSDIGLFASSCENMPNTLIELMGTGIPIVCSNRGPMLEVLESKDFTFDPFIVDEISNAILKMITNYNKGILHGKHCLEISNKYTWLKCSNETFRNIFEVYSK